ncbi:MAG: hypothetical protein WAM82_31405 [Thermoanaerobaculia bacterium]
MSRRLQAQFVLTAALVAFAGTPSPSAADIGPAINPAIYKVPAGAKTINVDCDAQQTLAGALADKSNADLNIVFSGTCKEYVYIQRDGVAIRGKDSSATVAGGIEVTAARRVLLEGFTCRDNTQLEYCIGALLGSSVTLHNIKVFNSSIRGLSIFNSDALIDGLSVDKTISTSILVRGSHVRIEGENNFSNTIEGCLVVDGTSSVFSKSGTFNARDCLAGVIVQSNSSFQAPYATFNLNHNTWTGLALITHGTFSYGGTMVIKNNTQSGIFVDEISSFSPFSNLLGSSTLTLENNGLVGVYILRGSSVELANVAANTGSKFGVLVDDGSLRISHSQISGNKTADLYLQFGGRATFLEGVVVGTTGCDGSQNLRGPKAACTPEASTKPTVAKPSPAKPGAAKTDKD